MPGCLQSLSVGMISGMVVILLTQFFSLPQNLLLLLWWQPLYLIPVVVDEIERLLVVTDWRPWSMIRVAITTIPSIGPTVVDRTRIVAIGRPRIWGVTISIAIIDGWRITIPISATWHPRIAVVPSAS